MQAEFKYRPRPWNFLGVTAALLGLSAVFFLGDDNALSPGLPALLGYTFIGIWVLGAPFSLHALFLAPGRIEIGPQGISYPRNLRRLPGQLEFGGEDESPTLLETKNLIAIYQAGAKKVEFKKSWFRSEQRWTEFRELLLERMDLDSF